MSVDILAAIKSHENLKTLADNGQDSAIADAINASLARPTPITVQSLSAAAPTTLEAIAAGQNPLAEIDVIASRVRASDWDGVGAWADTLHLLGKMSDAEHSAVEALVTAANVVSQPVTHDQVSAVLNAVRPVVEDAIRATPINWSVI